MYGCQLSHSLQKLEPEFAKVCMFARSCHRFYTQPKSTIRRQSDKHSSIQDSTGLKLVHLLIVLITVITMTMMIPMSWLILKRSSDTSLISGRLPLRLHAPAWDARLSCRDNVIDLHGKHCVRRAALELAS